MKLFALAVVCALAVVVVGTGSGITGPKVIRLVSIGAVDVNLDSEGEPKAGDLLLRRRTSQLGRHEARQARWPRGSPLYVRRGASRARLGEHFCGRRRFPARG